MSKPLCIDLYCGLDLREPEFCLRADPAIKQFVAGGAENPNHVGFGVLDFTARPVASVLWAVSEFDNPSLSARLAGARQGRKPPTEPRDYAGVLERSARIVVGLGLRVLPVERAALLSRCLASALIGAIAPIARRWRDVEMRPAHPAIPASPRDVRLFAAPEPTNARLASEGAVTLVRSLGDEALAATLTK